MPSRLIFFSFLISGCAALTSAHAAQPPQANSALPEFIQRGTEQEVVVAGDGLEGVSRVDIHGAAGLEAAVVPDNTPPEKRDKKTAGKSLKIRIHAAPNAMAGDRELRLIGPGGVSNPFSINVGLYPIIPEKEPNNTAEQAQKVTLPAVIAGTIDGAGDVDMFKFAAKKGETIVFEVQASRSGSKLDSSLRILDLAGKVIARDEDTNDLDSLIPFHPPHDGEFLLQIRDLRYQGAKDFNYRIVAGHTPYLESVFPPGGRRGTSIEVEPRGFNLEGILKFPVTVDAAAPLGVMPIHADSAAGQSNDVAFEVNDLPEVNEVEPNDGAAAAQAVAVPVVVNGRIGREKDADFFRFAAKKGQRLSFEVSSARIGSPIDPMLILYTAKGEFLQQDDMNGKFERAFDADGEGVICVRDLHDRGGPEFQYRLTIREPVAVPTFSVKFTPDRVRLHRGGRAKLWCDTIREAGFAGDVKIAFENLPKGVSAEAYIASTKNQNSGLLLLSAADDADLGAFELHVNAASDVKGKSFNRAAEPVFNKRSVRSAYVTTLEAAPFTVAPAKELSKEDREKYAAERAELEKSLSAPMPELDAAQAKWEAGDVAKSSWTSLDATDFKSAKGATLKKLDDGSILVSGKNDPKDTYTVVARTSLAGVTAIRLEALSDGSLPDGGPGRSGNGNFVMSTFLTRFAPGEDPNLAHAAAPVKFVKASSDFSQGGFSAQAAIDGSKTGWAISPEFGKSHTAIFEPEKAFGEAGVKTFEFTLECTSQHAKHTLGRFRLSATSAAKPVLGGQALPDGIREILLTEKNTRSDEQKKKLADYYRSISPELAAKRERIAQLSNIGSEPFPPVAVRNAASTLNVEVKRAPGFKGDIKIDIVGFTTGSKEGEEQPASTNLDITPATLRGDQTLGGIVIKPKGNCPIGTRDIVIVAETKVGNETIVQVSERIPLTVKEKK